MHHILWIGLVYAAVITAVPSPATLDSNVRLLFQNNLNWTEASLHQGAIHLGPRNSSAAAAACSQLGETLLVPNSTFFTSDFTHSLAYLAYSGSEAFFQSFWISPSSDGTCQALGPFGVISRAECGSKLPVLCSQSVTFNSTTISPSWEIAVESQGLTLTGTRDQRSFRFLGVPYGNNPERFTYSTLYSGPSAINATTFGSACVQVNNFGPGEEDCLFLNIFTPYLPQSPEPPRSSLKPVLFWIHGGGYTTGTGNDVTFDGGSLASRGDVVVVAINYRLSTLGFLALNDGVTNGNFGLADQVTALDWVRKYIVAFGGDPDRITISGQSAGAWSVRALLGSPKAIGKFAGAILQSDPAGSGASAPYTIYDTIEQEMAALAEPVIMATGCNSTDSVSVLPCLRAYDAFGLVNMTNIANYLVVDGTYLTTDQLVLNGSRPIAHVHTMIGNMRDDAAALIGYPTNTDLAQAVTAVMSNNQTTSALIASGLFPEPQSSNGTLDVFNVTARIATDTLFRCIDQATAVAAAQHDLFKSLWYYQFDRSYQLDWWSPNPPLCNAPIDAAHPYGDPSQEYFHCHSGELYYAFGTLGLVALPFRDANDLPFAQLILDHWSAFMRTYDPNPDPMYLAARGYVNTANTMLLDGAWVEMKNATAPTRRLLAVPNTQEGFEDAPQCSFLNFSLSYYE